MPIFFEHYTVQEHIHSFPIKGATLPTPGLVPLSYLYSLFENVPTYKGEGKNSAMRWRGYNY